MTTLATTPAITQADLIARLREALRGTPAQSAYLFGSWSAGTADVWSDLDLVVVCETDRPFFDRFREFDPLYQLPWPIDLLIYRPDEVEAMKREGNPLIEQVLQKGLQII